MPISKTPKQEIFPLRSIDQAPGPNRYGTIPTATDLRGRKLFGIPLKSSITGEELGDEAIDFYVRAAISEIEHVLDLAITPVTYREKHDYRRNHFTWNYNYLKLDHPNIISINKFELSFTNDADSAGFVDFPLEHVHIMPQEGVVQLVPAFGTSLSGFLLSAFSGTQFHALRATGLTDFPGGVRVEYTAGFCEGKIPMLIVELIESIAAHKLLATMGPIFFPNNSVSIGIDGVSQSTGNSGAKHFNDRIEHLEKAIETQYEALKTYYQRRFLVDYF